MRTEPVDGIIERLVEGGLDEKYARLSWPFVASLH